jgi:hypothetical protein
LKLDRTLDPSEGRIAVIIGTTDISSLFSVAPDALAYDSTLPLPTGDSEMVVYLVSGVNVWQEIGKFKLSVAPPSAPAPANNSTNNGSNGRKTVITPSLTLGMKSQPSQYRFPASNPGERETFADFTLQGGLRVEMPGSTFGSQMQFEFAGSSYRREALRFAQEGDEAPRIDLASYLMQFQTGKAKIQVGHLAVGSNRHLINSFSSRGVSVTVPITGRADFSLAALNGSSIVGWDNFIGLNRRKHQILAGTLGFELLPATPGRLRIEGGLLHGSLLPISSFNQGMVPDAEQSKGLSVRAIAADPKDRIRVEGGFARSRFNNPADPQLNQSFDVVPVRETSRDARYLDLTLNLLRDAAISTSERANLAFNYRHERVDPLFRSVAAYNQADRLQNQIEVIATVADISATVAHHRANDNLANLPTILKTLTRRNGILIGAPLGTVFNVPGGQATWWPRISYGFDRTHQLGAGLPPNSGFALSHVPDQLSTNQNALADWQFQRIRFGYRFNRSFQDNRQPGRELADLRNVIQGFTVGLTPRRVIDINFDLNSETAKNFESRRIDKTLRAGAGINWAMTGRAALAASFSTVFAGDVADVSESRNVEVDLQWSYRFGLERSRYRKVNGQFFVRYADRYQYMLDSVFLLNNRIRLRTLNVGLSFTFF